MFTEFKNTFRRLRGQIIGWGIGLFLYDALMASFYDTMQGLGDQLQKLLDLYPPQLLAFFPGIDEFLSPIGYLDTYFFSYMTIIVGIFAVSQGANLIVRDEENGILDLVIAYPVERWGLFWGRVLGYLSATVLILFIAWLGWALPAKQVNFPLSGVEMLNPFLSLLGFLLVFGGFALLISFLLPAARAAGGLTGGLLVANFLLSGMSNIKEELKPIYEVTPMYFTQGGSAITDPNWAWILGMIGVALLLFLASGMLFQRRDIRVGGEGDWQIPFLRRRRKAV